MRNLLFYLSILSSLFLFPLQQVPAQNPSTTSQISVVSYEELLVAIRQTRAESRARVEQAVEQEKVREAWETGKLIDKHILFHKERADYGEYVLTRLANDLTIDRSELYRMLEFARAYPIVVPARQLSWSHYESLLALNDPKERDEVAQEAVHRHWTRDQVREEVRKRQASKKSGGEIISIPTLTAQPGKLHAYRVTRAKARQTAGGQAGANEDDLVIDLGFSNYYKPEEKIKFQEGDIVQAEKHGLKKLESATEVDLYTYQIEVIQVIDGDTFIASVDLGFGFSTVQKLRLRGIDAREIESAEGMRAKKFLEKKLQGSPILIRTVKSDKYDRYLADVFVRGKYVNQELIDQHLAILVQE